MEHSTSMTSCQSEECICLCPMQELSLFICTKIYRNLMKTKLWGENPAGTAPSIQERHKDIYVESNSHQLSYSGLHFFLPFMESFNQTEQVSALKWKVSPILYIILLILLEALTSYIKIYSYMDNLQYIYFRVIITICMEKCYLDILL